MCLREGSRRLLWLWARAWGPRMLDTRYIEGAASSPSPGTNSWSSSLTSAGLLTCLRMMLPMPGVTNHSSHHLLVWSRELSRVTSEGTLLPSSSSIPSDSQLYFHITFNFPSLTRVTYLERWQGSVSCYASLGDYRWQGQEDAAIPSLFAICHHTLCQSCQLYRTEQFSLYRKYRIMLSSSWFYNELDKIWMISVVVAIQIGWRENLQSVTSIHNSVNWVKSYCYQIITRSDSKINLQTPIHTATLSISRGKIKRSITLSN